MDKEEQQFFEEMKPLLQDYVEFTKEDMSKRWEYMEKEVLAKVEESQARLDEAKEKQDEAIKNRDIFEEVMPKLKILGEKVYKPVEDERKENQKRLEAYAREYNSRNEELKQANEEVEQTKVRIEQEKQERIQKQQEKQESVYAKAKEYIDSTREEMRQEVEEKTEQLEKMTKQKKELVKEAKIASDLTLTIENSPDEVKKSETYKAFSEKANEELQTRIAMYKAYNQDVRLAKAELERAEDTLASFEEKYDAIDFASEAGIQSLIEITGWEEESVIAEEQDNEIQEMDENEETEPEVEETEEQEETREEEPEGQLTEKQKWDEIRAIYKERESGREDLLSSDYLVIEYRNLAMKDVDEAMKVALSTKGKSLLEIYKNMLEKMEKSHPHYQDLEKLVEKVRKRDKELQMTESHDGKLSPSERAIMKALNGEKKCLVYALKAMYRDVEQNFKDLLIPAYREMKKMEIENAENSYSVEEVKTKLLAMASKTLKDVCFEQLQIAKQEEDQRKIKGITAMIARVEKREEYLKHNDPQKTTEQNPTEQDKTRQNPAGPNPAGPNPTSGNQILQPGQEKKFEMPISRIEVDSNKGKMTVHYSDGIGADPVEYDIMDILKEKNTILWRTEKIGTYAYASNYKRREIFKEMKPKDRKAILKSANIFVLKAFLDYEKKNEIEGSRMIEAYINNIDIINNVTKSRDESQMPLPEIVHQLTGSTLDKKYYKKVVRYADKDRKIDGVQISNTMIEITWKERLAELFGRTPQDKERKTKAKQEKIRKREEKERAKTQRAEEKEMAKSKRKRERGVKNAEKKRERGVEKAEAEAKKESQEMEKTTREKLGIEMVDINHEKAMKDAELVSEEEMKNMKEMLDQMQH